MRDRRHYAPTTANRNLLISEGGSTSTQGLYLVDSTPLELSISIEFKEGMVLRDFNRKIRILENAIQERKAISCVPHGVSDHERRQVTRDYRKNLVQRINSLYSQNPTARHNALERLRKSDIDHSIDLQLSGTNNIGNLKALDSYTNQEIGRQISRQLPKGSKKIVTDLKVDKKD